MNSAPRLMISWRILKGTNMEHKIRLFQKQKIRAVWDANIEEWYFSVVDVVGGLTDSTNPTDYLKKMRKRDTILHDYIGTNCPQVSMPTETGKTRKTLAGTTKQILRIIQSIPSPKAEPFKLWLAEMGNDRLNEMQNPELAIDRAMLSYRNLGYSEEWINTRLQSIQFRKELTDEWKRTGVKEGLEYAILTNLMTEEWAGKTIKEYKRLKGLKKENLRDNMTSLELALNILAETSTTELSKTHNPKNLTQNREIARRGGKIAGDARKSIESQSGRSVISAKNAEELRRLEKPTQPKK